jgi:ATP-dependent Clp protease ATP-binding subunit ClpX
MPETNSIQMQGGMLRVMSRYKPSKIKAYLDTRVIGQEEAKKTLAVAVYNHMKRSVRRSQDKDTSIRKSNVILLGGTGCGKTFLAQCIADYMNVPCYIQDCTKITASGYVGSDVEDCVGGLLRMCKYDLEKAQHGIVVLDEIDKNASREAGMSITRDVSGECVQQSLLKIVEGDIVGVPPAGGRKHPEQPLIYVDTSDILFIASGAFTGLDAIVSKRLGAGGRIGFDCSNEKLEGQNLLDSVTPQDLREFGMIPEFVGRFPIISHVETLGRDELVRILREPKGALVHEYKELLEMDGIELSFSDEALNSIADSALELGTGARGLRSVMESFMRDVMFEAPDMSSKKNKCIMITKEIVEQYARNTITCGKYKKV